MRICRLSLLFLLACGPELPDAVLHGVEPAWGYNGEETLVRLSGEHFFPRVKARGGETLEFGHDFEAHLTGPGAVELSGLELIDYSLMEARVPEGLEPGDYDLRLVGPTGKEAQLINAFMVTDTRADNLQMTVDEVTHQVNSLARVEIQLFDPAGHDVAMPMEVVLTVSGQEDGSEISFQETLDNQESLEDEMGIRGSLSPNGMGFVALTSTQTEELWVTVSPADEGSNVTTDTQFLAFTAGEVSHVQVTLPSVMEDVGAGEVFPIELTLMDALGNATEGVTAALTIVEACNASAARFERTVQIVDSTIVKDAYASTSTETAACPENQFQVSGTAGGTFVEGVSDGFFISAGPAAMFEVEASPGVVEAGGEPLYVRVEAQDQYGNPVPDFDELLTIRDDLGGLDLAAGMGEQGCFGFNAGVNFCQAWPWKAADQVVLSVDSESGLTGASSPVQVLPGAASQMIVGLDASTAIAGEAYGLTIRVIDVYGNGLSLEPEGADNPVFSDQFGNTECVWQGAAMPAGTQEYSCISFTADAALQVEVSLASKSVSGVSDLITIENGALAGAEIDIGGTTTIVAGESLSASMQLTDAYGNPYLVQSISTVSLYDKSGELAGESLPIDPAGRASSEPVLTRSIVGNALVVRDGLSTLGSSVEFDVVASDMNEFSIEPSQTWAWLDEPLAVTVTAVDSYGNAVLDYSGDATVQSVNDLGDPVMASAFSSGAVVIDFEFSAAGLADVLQVDDGSFVGISESIDAVANCSDGPMAGLLLGGQQELIQCLVSGATPAIAMDASSTVAGSSSVGIWHFNAGDGVWIRDSSAVHSHSWSEEGYWQAAVLAVDEQACASEVSAIAWIADNDGQPAGPVSVSTNHSTMIAGSSKSGSVTVDIAATDCTGDPSSGGVLLIQADLGEVDLTSSGSLSASGSGIELLLDSDGIGSFDWTVEGQGYAGNATLQAGLESGAAYGMVATTVTGDSVSPIVLYVDPAGTTEAVVDRVEVVFSDPMLATSATTSTVTVLDPDGGIPDIASIDVEQDTLTVTFSEAQDLSAGLWSLGLSLNIRDSSGNRLDGNYSGAASSFSLEFGDVTDSSPDVNSCSASPEVFRPDGDDGAGEEADFTTLSFSATSVPEWWEIEILDANGETLWLTRSPGTTASETIQWAGRDLGGFIASEGVANVIVTALDDYWNPGMSCSSDVEIVQTIRTPD